MLVFTVQSRHSSAHCDPTHWLPLPTVGDLCQYINNKMQRPEHAPLFIYANNEIVTSRNSTMAELYQEYREDDYFLYLAYYEENVYSTQ